MKDKSIFVRRIEGWIETDNHRFEEKGNDIWGAYEKKINSFGEGDSFIFVGYMMCESSNAQTLTDMFLKQRSKPAAPPNMIHHEECLKTLKTKGK